MIFYIFYLVLVWLYIKTSLYLGETLSIKTRDHFIISSFFLYLFYGTRASLSSHKWDLSNGWNHTKSISHSHLFNCIPFFSSTSLHSQSLWQPFTSHINQRGYLGIFQIQFNKLLIITFSIQCHPYWLWFNEIYRWNPPLFSSFSQQFHELNIFCGLDKINSSLIQSLSFSLPLILFIVFVRTSRKV